MGHITVDNYDDGSTSLNTKSMQTRPTLIFLPKLFLVHLIRTPVLPIYMRTELLNGEYHMIMLQEATQVSLIGRLNQFILRLRKKILESFYLAVYVNGVQKGRYDGNRNTNPYYNIDNSAADGLRIGGTTTGQNFNDLDIWNFRAFQYSMTDAEIFSDAAIYSDASRPTHSWDFRNKSGQTIITDNIDGTSNMSFYQSANTLSTTGLSNNNGATLTGSQYLVSNQSEIFEAPYTIEIYVRPESKSNTNGFARLIGVAPSGTAWGNTYGYTLFGHGDGGITDLTLAHGGSVKIRIENFFTETREDKHIVLSVHDDSTKLYYHSDTANVTESNVTDQSTHDNANRLISLGTEEHVLTNYFKENSIT